MAISADDARSQILEKLEADLERSRLRPVGKDVLIAIYDRSGQKTAGGVFLVETEDKFQGKVGLVLKLGPLCNEERSPGYDRWFGGEPPQVGDWVGMKINDGVTVTLGETICRFVEWDYIRFLSDVPDLVM
jgi:co-chaperonin GroES (HSP10)